MIRSRLVALACFLSVQASAHHSDVGLDMNATLTVEGRVKEFSLRNPHAYIVIEPLDTDGNPRDWTVQMGSAITLARRGWKPDSLAVGDRVSASLHPARDGRPYGLLVTAAKGGVEIGSEVPGETRRDTASARALSIQGRWIVDRSSLAVDYPGGLDQLTLRDLELTEKGRSAAAAYSQNSEENPELSCTTKPTPSMIIYTDLYPIEIVANEAESLTIRSQYFDEVRTVYLDGRPHPDASELFHEGHSVGRWEGDTFVIDTRNFSYHRSPYQNGIPSGPRKHVVERYRLIDDGSRMVVTFMLEDPEYIVGSMTHERILLYRPDTDMSPFQCDLEATRRFLPSNLATQ